MIFFLLITPASKYSSYIFAASSISLLSLLKLHSYQEEV